jgi:hypothetical protein
MAMTNHDRVGKGMTGCYPTRTRPHCSDCRRFRGYLM